VRGELPKEGLSITHLTWSRGASAARSSPLSLVEVWRWARIRSARRCERSTRLVLGWVEGDISASSSSLTLVEGKGGGGGRDPAHIEQFANILGCLSTRFSSHRTQSPLRRRRLTRLERSTFHRLSQPPPVRPVGTRVYQLQTLYPRLASKCRGGSAPRSRASAESSPKTRTSNGQEEPWPLSSKR
jgi:hypothetical protein